MVASTLSVGNTMSRFCCTPPVADGWKLGPAGWTCPPPCTVGCALTAGDAFGIGAAPGTTPLALTATEGTPLPGTTPPAEGTTGGTPPVTGTTGTDDVVEPGGTPTTPGCCGGVLMLAVGIPGMEPGGVGTPGPAPAIGGYGLPLRNGGRSGEFCDVGGI